MIAKLRHNQPKGIEMKMKSEMKMKVLYHAVRRASTRVSSEPVPSRHVHRETRKASIASAYWVPKRFAAARDVAASAVAAARSPNPAPSMDTRLREHIANKYSEVISDRGGETAIDEKCRRIPLSVLDRNGRISLLGADGWRYYSARFGSRTASLRYLCGRDDNGEFAVRLPSTVDTVEQAIETLEPAEVRKARADGRSVLRQGDVYVIAMRGGRDNFSALPESHKWDEETRTIRHAGENPHQSLHIPFKPAKAITQTALRMGRGSGAGRGD